MKKAVSLIVSFAMLLSLYACSGKTQWTDFVKLGGTMYYNAESAVPTDLIDKELGTVKSNPPDNANAKTYKVKENQASYLKEGTKLYSIKGYEKTEYIAAENEDGYVLYKVKESKDVVLIEKSTAVTETTTEKSTKEDTSNHSEKTTESTTYPLSWNSTTKHNEKTTRTTENETLPKITKYTMQITSKSKAGFTAKTPWPSPITYKVKGELGEKYCVNDIVEVGGYGEKKTKENVIELIASSVSPSDFKLNENVAYKPVIYLYPTKKTDVSVKLKYSGRLTYTYPLYNNSWHVTAYPDGTLKGDNGILYPYLFWEGENNAEYDMSKGFCVKGSESEDFLREKLAYLGLNEKEINDFLEFWLPKLENNNYNLVTFQTDCYTSQAVLEVSPKPDSIVRVFMVSKPLEEKINCQPQKLQKNVRKGFALVEWGGSIAK